LYTTFCRYLTEQGMDNIIKKAGGILAGYSGGADSSLMLRFLKQYCTENKLSLYAAHVHHGIRGAAADKDALFCEEQAKALEIPFFLCREDVPKIAAEKGIGVEEAARQIRYCFFADVIRQLQIPELPVATAHNADDNLETVLFHMCRGSGLHGLCGIPPVREKRYIRPMLPFTAEEIRVFCDREKIAYTEDMTNADTVYTRNYIRHEIVPRLKQIHPNPAGAVLQMTELLRADDVYLEQEVDSLIGSKETIQRKKLADMSPVLRSRVLRKMYHKARCPGDDGTLSKKHIEDMNRCIIGTGSQYTLSLPDNINFRIENGYVSFRIQETAEENRTDLPVFYPDGTGVFENEYFVLTLSRKNQENLICKYENIYKLSIQQTINFATIKGVMGVRYRLPGDTIRYGGMTRKIKKLLSEKHVPETERRWLPILTDDAGILWLPGFPPRDGMQCPDGDILTVCLYSKENRL